MELLTVKQITKQYPFSEYTLRAWIASKSFPVIRAGRTGKKVYVDKDAFESFLREGVRNDG